MLTVEHLNQLVDAMRANGITTLEVEGEDYSVRLVRDTSETATPLSVRTRVTSPVSGRFAARGGDDGLPPLARGTAVATFEILGYLCIGPVRMPVDAPCSGRIVGTLPADGRDVGQGETLFIVEAQS